MPPKKKSISPKCSDFAKKKSINDVTESMTLMSVAPPVAAVKTTPSICLDFCFPVSKYTVMDEMITKIFVELVGCQLPGNYLKHAKVLPGGRKFSILISAPCMMYKEGFIRARMGEMNGMPTVPLLLPSLPKLSSLSTECFLTTQTPLMEIQ
jgi:hypothetical protein